jgi:hypothetical protein
VLHIAAGAGAAAGGARCVIYIYIYGRGGRVAIIRVIFCVAITYLFGVYVSDIIIIYSIFFTTSTSKSVSSIIQVIMFC